MREPFDHVREHNMAVNRLDFITARAPITVDYAPGALEIASAAKCRIERYVVKKNGDEPVNATVSPVLEDKIARHRGHVTSEVLPHVYAHLTPLVGSA